MNEREMDRALERRIDGTISLILIFGLIILGLVAAIINLWVRNDAHEKALENTYEKSFFNISSSMNELETKLNKLKVTHSESQRMLLANDIWKTTSIIEDNLAQLPIDHYAISNTSKFVNQAGDYIYSLNRKLQKGGTYSEEDIKTLDTLADRCATLNQHIQQLANKIASDYRIVDHINHAKLKNNKKDPKNLLGTGLSEINQETIDYPEMIYDGPFSDALVKKEYKVLQGLKEISYKQGIDYILKKLKDTTNVNYKGKAEGDLKAYEYVATTKDGLTRYIQLSVKGGLPVSISSAGVQGKAKLNEEQAKAAAKEWAKKLIDQDLEGVWISVMENTAFVNLAPVVNDIIYYPDLIKVKVSLVDGNILGWEANSYLQNHIDRDITPPAITQEQAKQKVSPRLKIQNVRLALIPKEWGEEVLTYEFYSTYNDNLYIVYINAESGQEENILMVINTPDRGRMLI
ncbi:MAG TPA: germination protein YpeB [Clostridia bacterium]